MDFYKYREKKVQLVYNYHRYNTENLRMHLFDLWLKNQISKLEFLIHYQLVFHNIDQKMLKDTHILID
jgi:hypothetical protein